MACVLKTQDIIGYRSLRRNYPNNPAIFEDLGYELLGIRGKKRLQWG